MKHATGGVWIAFVAVLAACTTEDEATRAKVATAWKAYSVAESETTLGHRH